MKKMMKKSETLGERVAQKLLHKKDEVVVSVANKMHEKCDTNQTNDCIQSTHGVRVSISPSWDVIYVEDMNDECNDEKDKLEE